MSFSSLEQESSISWKIRILLDPVFFNFSSSESSVLKLFNLAAIKFHCLEYKENFFLGNIRTFFILGPESSISCNITIFFLEKYKKLLIKKYNSEFYNSEI